MTERVLYLVVCAAGPAGRIDVMVKLAQHDGWSVYCLATPATSSIISTWPNWRG